MKLASIGECMLELNSQGEAAYSLAFGGDTLNTAVYLSRLGIDTDYVTALGDDPMSEGMLEAWRKENIGTDMVLRAKDRMPGLYMIQRDDKGERSFLYWRDRAPARELFEMADAEYLNRLESYDILYLSGITLSLYTDSARAQLFALLERFRSKGGKVAFDGNYRPRGWPTPDAARKAFDAALARADFAFPTLDDEQMLYNDKDAQACSKRMGSLGVSEVVVKEGAKGCLVVQNGKEVFVPSEAAITPVDTTAAGDSFNAGYLAARLKGLETAQSARVGHRLAATVICHKGAIIPKNAMPKDIFAR